MPNHTRTGARGHKTFRFIVDGSWKQPLTSETMQSIRQIEEIRTDVHELEEKLRKVHGIPKKELRVALDKINDNKDMVHLEISLEWETACKAAEAGEIHRKIDVLNREVERRRDDDCTTLGSSIY